MRQLDHEAGYLALTGDVAAVAVELDVLVVEGSDAASFLQGQLSQDVAGLPVGATARSLVLQPQGKVASWPRVTRQTDDRFLLDVAGGHGEVLAERLRRFLLRVDVELTAHAHDQLVGVGLRGPRWGEVELVVEDELLRAPVAWPGLDGIDVLALGAVGMPDDLGAAPSEAMEARRIEVGLPSLGVELDGDTIPEEAGVVAVSVDFDKGCYVGQELVARVDSRGRNVPRRLRGLLTQAVLDAGSDLEVAGKVVGRVTSAAVSPRAGPVALGYVARSVEVGSTVAAGPDSVPATVAELPL